MMKYALLAGAMTFAMPSLAQTARTTALTPSQTAPATNAGTTTSVTPSTTAAPTTPTPATAMLPVQQAATQPASGDQVAQIVDSEFPGHDKNGDGKLSSAEFGAWMVALKTKTDPSTKAGTPETKKWVDAAFAQADTDKSRSLSKTEVTSFLSHG